ncbi:MAG: hypothetical protein N2482_03125 [Patescibacteria group bacterium]|nr:hypothetical protein [Patescibacteria group bacterium]
MREDKRDDLDSLIQAINQLDGQGIQLGVAIDGILQEDFNLGQNLKTLIKEKKLNVVLHIGLEDENLMKKRLRAVLDLIISNPNYKDKISLYITGNFGQFMSYYNNLSNDDKKILQEIIKMSSPFNYLVFGSEQETKVFIRILYLFTRSASSKP